LISLAGFPAIKLKGGKLLVTTEFAPTTLFRPKVSSPFAQKMTALYPNQQLRPMVILPPDVVPCT
jgi:hypothetical protein